MQKLRATIGDNASTNNTLCCTIEAHLLEEEDIEWNASHWRMRCIGHIINLVVQAFLFQNVIEMEELELYND